MGFATFRGEAFRQPSGFLRNELSFHALVQGVPTWASGNSAAWRIGFFRRFFGTENLRVIFSMGCFLLVGKPRKFAHMFTGRAS